YIMFGIDKLINWAIGKRRKNAFDLKEKDINNKITIVKMEAELDSAKNNHRNLLDLNNLYGQHENEIIRIKTDIRSLFESVGNIKNNIDAAAISKVEEQSQFDYDYKEEGEFRSKYHSEFISTDLFKYFPSIGLSVSKSKSIPENINELVVEKFITEDIIKRTHDASTDKYYMAFTKKGYSFWKQYLASTPLE
ncbi:MAG: hypothetical protein MI975_03200, partial [Cytophagales bacterium]|nr:hypothetical protein [Cytophagales bacterium]